MSKSQAESVPSIPHDVLKLGFDLMWLGAESQAVIAMRLMGLGGLWHIDADEPGLMVLEKHLGFAEATGAALAAASLGARFDQVLSAAVEPLRNRTAANARRLSQAGLRFAAI
ncbi:antifreeze protein [Mangrovicoccus sp. HB161399]|uniref:antifreeze protein n=1 Tax=Mangrovicoccus sp. HB161399 TaxID=2720392 RepID=UPI001554B80E|nr:antifreeze protein [Mangrovicoccus sp. HB161399]